jgi:hypothetical protein
VVTRKSFAALALACVVGCAPAEPEPWSALRVVVDTDAEVPTDLDAFSIAVERGGVALFDQTFAADVIEALPDSLVIINPSPSNDSPEKQLETVPVIDIIVTGLRQGDPIVTRSASLRFNAGQVQLPLPMCRQCFDLMAPCDDGTTCKRGTCEDDFIASTRDLPEDDGTLAPALGECGGN